MHPTFEVNDSSFQFVAPTNSNLEDLAAPRPVGRQDGLQVRAAVGGHAAQRHRGRRRLLK